MTTGSPRSYLWTSLCTSFAATARRCRSSCTSSSVTHEVGISLMMLSCTVCNGPRVRFPQEVSFSPQDLKSAFVP